MRVITREEWKARPPKSTNAVPADQRDSLFVHYSTGQELGREDTAEWVRQIQNFHMDDRGWDDIGYNYVIDKFGNIFEGRGFEYSGAHAIGYNTTGLGVCFLGNDDPNVNDVTPAVKRAYVFLWGQLSAKASRIIQVQGHRDVNQTSCPGDELYQWAVMEQMPFTEPGLAPPGQQPPPLPPTPEPPPPPPPPPVVEASQVPPFPGLMQRGSHGDGVRQLQQRLKDRGWNIGTDGEFGRQTDTIVHAFQTEKGLESDGIVGPVTWDALWTSPIEGATTQPPPAPPAPPPPPPPSPQHPDPIRQCEAWGFDGNRGANPVEEFQRAFAWHDISIDGVMGPQTAEAVQIVVDRGGRLIENFSIQEQQCKHCGRILADREEQRSLQRARDIVGPMVVVSAYRCPPHNRAVGGARDSMHLYGKACDLRIPLHVAEQAGFTGIGTCGSQCLHGDRRDTMQRARARWGYC